MYILKLKGEYKDASYIEVDGNDCLATVIENHELYLFIDLVKQKIDVNQKFCEYPDQRVSPSLAKDVKIFPIFTTMTATKLDNQEKFEAEITAPPPKPAPETKQKTQKEDFHAILPTVVTQKTKQSSIPPPPPPKISTYTPPTVKTTSLRDQSTNTSSIPPPAPPEQTDPSNFKELVSQLTDMGLDEKSSTEALRKTGYDVTKAINYIFGQTSTDNAPPPQPQQQTKSQDSNSDPTYILQDQIDAILAGYSSSERDAINRLHDQGYSMMNVLQLFEACGKDENLTKNILQSQ
ncbi:UBA/TS-N domain containing protein [Trichomonas vaginalis G3]|uniref:UBA/TS-N domain containing protein n=1 Tax=Trichomonas vaginalis (strain ATCC PRA-98 / G3) TaxID=412133 RepID=A2E9G1_TRIV3|nr:UV excision repair protein RAD23 family [Trichomonas vaginalis G3]EAY10725.1 UBA/TS-N domain containing protein [Trichomonas vaginalis G3]KAI5538618.1 UV excision repair protein RAD23 family [Trichomonas vaginalis G3]|eukprot:XP_001322948.1 UBA/TS-N domain containing protein [Trichomonas vaginalis G3]